MTQNIGRHQKFWNKINKLRKVKSRTEDMKKRKVTVNNAASKLFNEQMVKLDDECNELSNAEKMSFALDTILVIYFLMITVIHFLVVCLCHH